MKATEERRVYRGTKTVESEEELPASREWEMLAS